MSELQRSDQDERPARLGLRTPLRFPSLFKPLWRESKFETHRRRSRMFLLGPLGALIGLSMAAISYRNLGVPLVVLAPLASMAGFGIMHLVANVETFFRLRGRGELGPRALAFEIGADLLGGSIVGAALGGAFGVNTTIAVTVAGAIVGIAGVVRRALMGDWIGGAVRFLSADGRAGSAPDYTEEYRLIAEGKLDDALDLFDKRSEERGGHPGPLVDAAQILRDRGRYERAIEYYAKALEAPNVDARRAAGFAKQIWEMYAVELKDAESAIPHLEALVSRHPDAPEVEWAWRELTVGMVVTRDADQDKLGAKGSHVPAVRAVERILSEAFVAHASDIHLEDYAGGLRVRYRIDGVLQDGTPPPARIRAAVLARVRVMAGLNPAENPLPQDARIRVPFAGRDVDIRVSTVPTLHGESVALRVLDAEGANMQVADLGLDATDVDRLMSVVERPHGMVLTTGPGGAGKSTTLHALVQHLSTGAEKIFTVEDPVEYGLDGVCQVSVNAKAGLTFARLLRSLVRQDPDVLLVGEIRDTETAEIATHASLTGHLVLSTLHTTDAVSALHRLVDIGVPNYMVVHTLEAAMAQRLVRRVCANCAEEVELTDQELRVLGATNGLRGAMIGRGCERCRGTGYKGRIGIYELMLVDEPMRHAFLKRTGQEELVEIARANGMHTLREDGIRKIQAGVTTPEEVLRATKAG